MTTLGPKDLGRALRRGERSTRTAIRAGVRTGAERGVAIVRKRVPVDQKELRDSVHVETGDRANVVARLVADAPHAAPVEAGSRPHTPPLAPLLAWAERKGLDARVAVAIQMKIRREGTKPTWYMRGALEALRDRVGVAVQAALAKAATKRGGTGA